MRDFAALLGVDTTTIANWRSGLGGVIPRSATQAILDTTLERRATAEDRERFEQIVGEGERAWRARHPSAVRQDEVSAASITVTTATSSSDVFEPPAEIVRRMSRLHAFDVDEAVIDVIDVAFGDVLGRYELEGPVRLAPKVHSLRQEVNSLLEQCRQPVQLQRLYRLDGQLAGALGYMAVNRGQFHAANMYSREALRIAEFIRDVELQAWVKGTQSFCAYYRAEYTTAVGLAEEGIRLAGDTAQAIRLYTNGLARALGKIGDVNGVERAVEAAMSIASSIKTPPGLTPALSFVPYSEARLKANAATAYLSAGDYEQTLTYGRQVEAHVNASDSVWSRSLVRLDVATALVHQPDRDVEHAMDLGVEALNASQDRPIRSVWQRAHDLADVVTIVDARKVKDYADELREWSAKARTAAAPDSATAEER
ncbi:transcriptional regulator [Nocardia puris]|nr:transcriptional regulator [Nocardia puris]